MAHPLKNPLKSELIICLATGIGSISMFAVSDRPGYLFLISFIFTCFLALSLKLVSGSYDRSFKDFFIGENNTYSLSRIQFFLWVFLILSCQISIIALLVKNDSLTSYNFIIGSNVLWILAASFGTYLSVQGIANRKKEENKLLVKDTQKFSDILVDGNRLDFTKFQMALWTLIAIGIYFFNNITYVGSINDTLQHSRASSKSLEDVTVFTIAVKRYTAKIEIVEAYLDNTKEESSKAVADSVLRENKHIEMALLNADSLHYLETASVETLIFELHIINDSIALNKPRITTQPSRKVEYGHWTILETSFLKKINLLFPVVTKERSDEVTSFNSQLKTYFSESTDGQSSSVPDISLTFLILMGLVQGTYIGKKLLPTQPLNGGVTSETAAAPAANDFSPVTPTSAKEFYELKLREALKLAEINFLPKPYVTGVDIGLKRVGGVTTDAKVIRIHVKEKLSPDKLSVEEKIPSMLNGVPTDVIRTNFTRQDFPHLSLHLPPYLTAESKNALREALKNFPHVSYDRFYTDYLKDEKIIFQGDGLKDLTFVNVSKQEFKSNKPGIILSNTCDMHQENERYFTGHMIYAPIVNLKIYSDALIGQGISTEKVNGHIEAIKNQSITQILYLPAREGVIDESMVFFDQIQNVQTESCSIEGLGDSRIFTLSDFGHYLFLFKLSFHFTRFQDKVERKAIA